MRIVVNKRPLTIFLSGGMHGGWQDRFIENYPTINFLDPRSHGLTNPVEYTEWDLNAIERCDAVIAYMESSNPSGVGTALEIGYAVGRGKVVYFICEKEDRYFDIALVAATYSFLKLEEFEEVFADHFLHDTIHQKRWL